MTMTIAELENVRKAVELMMKTIQRPEHLPGIVALTGFSGYGKTYAASYTANQLNAAYIQCQSTMTKKGFLEIVAKELGIDPKRMNMGEIMEQICSELVMSNQPLIFDECDYLIDKNMIEIVRDIYEGSHASILLIGEENFPRKLERYERFHNRILDWGLAQPCSLEDAQQLSKIYYPELDISDCLLAHVVKQTNGITRRVCVNLEKISEWAKMNNPQNLDRASWGDIPLWNGDAPKRRRMVG